MKSIYLSIVLAAFCLGVSHAQKTSSTLVFFDSDSHELTVDAQQDLKEWVSSIGLQNIDQLYIKGHTDADGSLEYNQALSERRASEVWNYLKESGMRSDQLALESLGEVVPVATNASDQGKQQNRRVEITATITAPEYGSIEDLFEEEKQVFRMKADEPIEIEGAQGTIVQIPANALVDANGKPARGNIRVELSEYYDLSSFLQAGLHTQSGDRMLETGGTIEIRAYKSGKELQLSPESTMNVLFKDREKGDGMQIFNGVEDENGNLDWVAQDQTTAKWRAYSVVEGIVFPWGIWSNGVGYTVNRNGDTTWYEVDKETIVNPEQAKMVESFMATNQLGWINCDRFSNERANGQVLALADSQYRPQVFLVFSDIKSVMYANNWDRKDGFIFNRIPKGRKATLVGISYVNDTPYFAMHDIVIGQSKEVELQFEPMEKEELKGAMAVLN